MSLRDATRREWKAFDRDEGSDIAKPPSCNGCDGPLDEAGHCPSCDDPAQGRVEALRACELHWSNKRSAVG